MRRHASVFVMAAMVVGSAVAWIALGRADRPKGKTIALFNGKDLTNFYTYLAKYQYQDPNQVFTVAQEEGAPAIRISGQDYGGLITQKEYENYHLAVEFKWGRKTWPPREGKAMDSGILLHGVGPDGNAGNGWMASVECQIIEGGCGDFILVGGKDAAGQPIKPSLTVECETRGQLYYKAGAQPVTRTSGRFNWYSRDPDWKDVLGFRGRQDVESPAGQWTRIEVNCERDQITNRINGRVVNVGTKSSLTKGKILIQSEGAEIFFRKIELTPRQ